MAKFFAKMVLEGVTVFGKAFYTAYQQAVQNGKPGSTAKTMGSRIKTKMKSDEALKILNIESSNLSHSTLEQQYLKYFESNDPKKGGSFYLQSKIYRAKEALDRELEKKNSSTSSSSSTNSSDTTKS